MKKLPIGIASFAEIRDDQYLYIDKTRYIQSLVESGKFYFLSRPRRFGKSLLADTIKELYEGNQKLFQGLHIHDDWEWEECFPVIKIDFTEGTFSGNQTTHAIGTALQANAERLGIEIESQGEVVALFGSLIKKVHAHFQKKVVIIVDEYDKPLLDNIQSPDRSNVRDTLRELYSVIKANGNLIEFAFLTGISKFSKVSIFSGLNNLNDITIDSRYSAVCGYTEQELDDSFAEYLVNVDREKMRRWYNGYSWGGEKVYNPFDVLLFIDKQHQYRPYWFETGTPTFLVEVLKRNTYHIPNFENLEASDALLSSFDIDNIEIETLLFQTGYLTIDHIDPTSPKPLYVLNYPNIEVKSSFTEMLLRNYLTDQKPQTRPAINAITSGEPERLEQALRSFFASIPFDNYRKNTIAEYEGYYASVTYAFLSSLGFETHVEETTNSGKIDLALKYTTSGRTLVYIFEFKTIKNSAHPASEEDPALQQIKDRNYAAKYREADSHIFLIGITFDPALRNISRFTVERDG